ncbi:pyridoxal phosphate-dependent transferase [Irpex lacteus]|nr:pyridoxal phosphate-dependent transferase [Irpex lacteus]
MSTFKLSEEEDLLRKFRSAFVIPTNKQMKASACTYLCGNSLGAMAKRSKALVIEELDVWGTRAVEGHFDHPHGRDWMHIADHVHPYFAEIVGAKESEVACMGTLTANLHLMMNTFYKPTQDRFKSYAKPKLASHGLKPQDAVIELRHTTTIAEHGASIALVLFSGVQYYTGQWFPMERITKAAQGQGAICGWDLAHAAGNVPLLLHDWNVDFAVWWYWWLFVHDRWSTEPIRAAGWWGHDPKTRFTMPSHFSAIPGAQGFQQSNPSVLATVSLLGSVQLFREAGGMIQLLHRSKWWISTERADKFSFRKTVVKSRRVWVYRHHTAGPGVEGVTASLVFIPSGGRTMPGVLKLLEAQGVVGDSRKPDVIRLAPAALYNTFEDVERAVKVLEDALGELSDKRK